MYFANAVNLSPKGPSLADYAYSCRCMKTRVGGSLCVFLMVPARPVEIGLWSLENRARAGSPTVTRRFPTKLSLACFFSYSQDSFVLYTCKWQIILLACSNGKKRASSGAIDVEKGGKYLYPGFISWSLSQTRMEGNCDPERFCETESL